jgi:hypothetical protein
VAKRRIQPKPSVEFATVTLRLPVEFVRAVDHYAKYLGGSTDRTYVMTQAIEIAMAQDRDFQKTLTSRAAGAVPCRSRDDVTAMPSYAHNDLTPGGTRTVPPASSRNTAVFTPAPSATHAQPLFPVRP